ncbi:aminopeptidase P family protein, partial [Gemmatimonas aurantiaca]|nr:aminopeptidase P family protein [Gemmatimonas aurantiaca]
SGVVTRRSFYFIPAKGEPIGFVHKIEEDKFVDLPGTKITYSSYKLLEQALQSKLGESMSAGAKLAMEYSPMGRLPYIGIVDAGTIELIRSFGFEIVTSADLVSTLQAALPANRRALQMEASRINIKIKDEAFDYIRRQLSAKAKINEYDVAEFIMRRYDEEGMIADHYPIVAVDGYAGNPHYEPMPESSNEIKMGSLILIDMWCKHNKPDGVYSDLCWMAYANGPGFEQPPELYVELFGYVLGAQQAAFDYIKNNFASGPVYGADADDASRKVITDAGYGEYFTHRTGHSITGDVHGSGPNIDNLETEDKRQLLPGHIFSLEPGIYNFAAGYGFRSEIDVLISESGPIVTTTPQQTELLLLFDK